MRIREYMYFSLVMETPLVYSILYQEMEKICLLGTGYGKIRISCGQSKRDGSKMEKLLSP